MLWMGWVTCPPGGDSQMEERASLGKYLKRERELKKVSLREVTKKTRIREHLLVAIEEDQWNLLPSTTYVRGFLLSYAKYLGLDPHEVLLRYETVLKGEPVIRSETQSPKRGIWNSKQAWVIGGGIALSLIVSYFFYPSRPIIDPPSSKRESQELLPSTPSPQRSAPTPVTGENPFSLRLKAVEETWVRIQVDGQPEKEMTFKPGEEGAYRALNRIYLIVGNAGGLDLIFNEKPMERFGKSGEVVTLTFTPQGVETKRPERQNPQ